VQPQAEANSPAVTSCSAEATGGGLKHPSLYMILSKGGNPITETLQEILKPLGLCVSVALDEAA
jgi:DNA-binding phage protein